VAGQVVMVAAVLALVAWAARRSREAGATSRPA
jgi:hypothetical protein